MTNDEGRVDFKKLLVKEPPIAPEEVDKKLHVDAITRSPSTVAMWSDRTILKHLDIRESKEADENSVVQC